MYTIPDSCDNRLLVKATKVIEIPARFYLQKACLNETFRKRPSKSNSIGFKAEG